LGLFGGAPLQKDISRIYSDRCFLHAGADQEKFIEIVGEFSLKYQLVIGIFS
jgi:hypothetical protein